MLDLAYYTQDLTGDDRGRLYGGGGVRASMPFSRLYPDVQSELFNLNGIYHKIVFSGNYYIADSNTRLHRLAAARPPQRRRHRPGPARHPPAASRRSTRPTPPS